jgi:hypothetical protein
LYVEHCQTLGSYGIYIEYSGYAYSTTEHSGSMGISPEHSGCT